MQLIVLSYWLTVWVGLAFELISAEFNPIEENLIFKINWPGQEVQLPQEEYTNENAIFMTTVDNEKFKCVLPIQVSQNEGKELDYSGPSALELLQPLFTNNLCIFKLEVYWGYELCHGKHLRQFHEEKESGKETKIQEFYLGRYNDILWKKDVEKFVEEWDPDNIPFARIEGHNLPYLEVVMIDGTPCDVNNNKPRQARIKYSCSPDVKHQVYSLEESSICEYEVLVLTHLLCAHPKYNVQTPKTNEIHCQAIEESPTKPLILETLESEAHQLNPYSKLTEAILSRISNMEELTTTKTTANTVASEFLGDTSNKVTPYDNKLVDDILNGEHCLTGGGGWWKYEFCHGKKVEQYHVNSNGKRTVHSLGTWNKEKHLKWLDKHPHKKAYNKRMNQVSQLYTDGDVCSETLKRRQVEVQLRCKESPDHPNAVSMSLMEPSICEYILTVESQIFCAVLSQLDDYGIKQDVRDKSEL